MRKHGWQRPFHALQIMGMSVFLVLVATFYLFLGFSLGNKTLETVVNSVFSAVVFSVILLFFRCSSIDPMDNISVKLSKLKAKSQREKALCLLAGAIAKHLKKIEKKFLRSCIKREYTDPWKRPEEMEGRVPLPLIPRNDKIIAELASVEVEFCNFCEMQTKKTSKHCRFCNKCIDGFDHHCKWMNNCVGRKNYTTFMLLITFLLIMLIIEAGTSLFVFVRCFAAKREVAAEFRSNYGGKFPILLLATVAALLFGLSGYLTAGLGQLYMFHIILIKKGIRTHDYLLAMREEFNAAELSLDDSASSSMSSSPASSVEILDNHNSAKKSSFLSMLKGSNKSSPLHQRRLSLGPDLEADKPPTPKQPPPKRLYTINPWKLIKLKSEEILKASEKAKANSSARQISRQDIDNEHGQHQQVSSSFHSIKIEEEEQQEKYHSPTLKPMPQEKRQGPTTRASFIAPPAAGDMEAMSLLLQNLPNKKTVLTPKRQHDMVMSWDSPPFECNSVASPRLPIPRTKKKTPRNSVRFISKENINPNILSVSMEVLHKKDPGPGLAQDRLRHSSFL